MVKYSGSRSRIDHGTTERPWISVLIQSPEWIPEKLTKFRREVVRIELMISTRKFGAGSGPLDDGLRKACVPAYTIRI